MSEKKEMPFVKNTIEIRKDLFDRAYVQKSLKSKFDDLRCSCDGCGSSAASVKDKELRCKTHMPQTSARDSFRPLSIVWYELEDKLKNLEEAFIKTQCVYTMMNSSKMNNFIDDFAFNDLKTNYDSVNDDLLKISKKAQEKSILMSSSCSFEDFDTVKDLCDEVQKKVEKVHQIAGTSICYFMSNKMMNGMMESNKKDHVDSENSIPSGVFTFVSLFCELDENMDKFDIKERNVFTSESNAMQVRNYSVGASSEVVESKGLSMINNDQPRVSANALDGLNKKEDPLGKSIDASKIDFHPSTPITSNLLSGGGLGSRPKIGGSNAQAFGNNSSTFGSSSRFNTNILVKPKEDPILENLPMGDESKSSLPPPATSTLGTANLLTSAPALDSIMGGPPKPFDPLGDSAIPSLSQRKIKRRVRPRMNISSENITKKEGDLNKTFHSQSSKSNKVIGDISDSEEDTDVFKRELKARAGKDESMVMSISPKSTQHDSEMQTEGSSKAVEAYQEAVRGRSEQQKSSLATEMMNAAILAKETKVETIKIEKINEPKPITEKDLPSSSPMMPPVDFDTEKLQKLLKKEDISSTSILKFHCEKLGDAEMLYEASQLKFPPIKKLELINMDDLIIDEDIQGANDMLGKAITTPIKYLYLGGGSHGDLKKFTGGLENILKLVTHQIFISGFTIDSDILSTIFEQAAKVDYLVLDDCKIELDSKFVIDTDIVFDIRQLDLYRTCRKEDKDYLDLSSLPKFVEELAKTSMRKSLSSVHIKESAYPAKEVQMIFDNAKFNTVVDGDEYRIDSLDA